MKVAKKLVELFSHQRAIKKYLKSLENDFTPKTIYVFLACAIIESESSEEFTSYKLPQVSNLLDKMNHININSQFQMYREHKKLLRDQYVQRLTKEGKFIKQHFCLTIEGRIQLRRIYNYLIRELYPSFE